MELFPLDGRMVDPPDDNMMAYVLATCKDRRLRTFATRLRQTRSRL